MRGRLATTAGAVLALLLTSSGCRPKTSPCTSPEIECGGQCVNANSDPSNCGGCGVICGAGQTCCGHCTDLTGDPNDCGACFKQCPTGGLCSSGACSCPPAMPDPCGVATGVSRGECVNRQTDPSHCGACGHVCAGTGVGVSDATCAGGACVCSGVATDCHGNPECVDLTIDPSNCGTCGDACQPRANCGGGLCACTSASFPDNCGPTIGCVDKATDAANCGACGNACTVATPTCSSGICCPAGQTSCSGVCKDLASDAANCGACGHPCPLTQACSGGKCGCTSSTPMICGTLCCAGTACCSTGTACQTKHDNGLGGSWFDCNLLYTPGAGSLNPTTPAAAEAAANSWMSGVDFPELCGGNCLGRQTMTSCSIWCFGLSSFSGHVTTGATINCAGLCLNFQQGPTPTWQ